MEPEICNARQMSFFVWFNYFINVNCIYEIAHFFFLLHFLVALQICCGLYLKEKKKTNGHPHTRTSWFFFQFHRRYVVNICFQLCIYFISIFLRSIVLFLSACVHTGEFFVCFVFVLITILTRVSSTQFFPDIWIIHIPDDL